MKKNKRSSSGNTRTVVAWSKTIYSMLYSGPWQKVQDTAVEEIKEYVSQEYLGSVEYTGLDGTPRTRVRSTSELDVEEMSGLIERVKQLANQLDVRMEHIEYG